MGSLSLFQGILQMKRSNPRLPHCRWILYQLSTREAQEYWSGYPICSSGDLPNPWMEPGSPALQVDSLPTELSGKPDRTTVGRIINTCSYFCEYSPALIYLLSITNEIQTVHSEGDQPWDFFGRHDATAETPVLWPPHAKSWFIGKDPDAGRDWGQEEKGMTEDEMAGWHHWLNGRESQWTLGVGDGQGGLACCDSWGCKESDTTERLIWSDLISITKLK